MQKMKDHLYAPPPRHKAIETIRDALVKAGKADPSNKRRFLTPKEADKLMEKWRDCKNANEFIALAKLRQCTALSLHYFEKVRDEDPTCNYKIQQYIRDEASLLIGMVRDLLRKQELSVGIGWPSRHGLTPAEVDRMVHAYVELSKVTDRRTGFIDYDQCDMYWLLMRRFYPGSKQRIQPIAFSDGRQGRLDAWVDF